MQIPRQDWHQGLSNMREILYNCGPASPPGVANVQAPLQTPGAGPTLCGSSSAAERDLAMVEATGSIPVSRSTLVSEVADGRWAYEARKRRASALVGG